jgi:hypothetical protein
MRRILRRLGLNLQEMADRRRSNRTLRATARRDEAVLGPRARRSLKCDPLQDH